MTNLPRRLILDTDPIANPAAIVQGDRYRFTVLTDRLIRLEYATDGVFEDRATQTIINRNLPVPTFEVIDRPGELQIITDHLHLRYDKQEFSEHGLSIVQRTTAIVWGSDWHYGKQPGTFIGGLPTNLGGTARTLDEADGPVPLEPGLVGITGYAVLDDSTGIALTDDGWFAERSGAIDLYFFGYGHDAPACLRAFYQVSGPQPLLPRYALGNWWSRYFRYTADSYLALMDRFAAELVPFSVAVIDMDWHLVDDVPREFGSGWTGYTWNRNFFPDPAAFLAELHARGMKVTLNVHPADGIRAFEDAYQEVAEAVGIDPETQLPVPFDLTNEDFLKAYFELVHHRLEDDGVDFWWLDWQQGGVGKIKGLDPLWLLNHFHYLDSARRGQRQLTFSRYAGPGSHRYPVGFSGDTIITWESLDFQPYFTATASNIGYGWWSHDIGGHMLGYKDNELETRWVQLGTFSPINRLHSSDNPFTGKEPWRYGQPAQAIQSEYLRLRHKLLPYLYTMNYRAHADGAPIVVPMYYEHADFETLQLRNQFRFGSELVVAPITSKLIPGLGMAKTSMWLPPGTWIDLTTGLSYDGDRLLTAYRQLASYPVLAKAGTIVPTDGTSELRADENPATLELWLVPGEDAEFELYEDDGAAAPRVARTRLTWDDASHTLTVHPVAGEEGIAPSERDYRVRVFGYKPAVSDELATGQDQFSVLVDLGRVVSSEGGNFVLPLDDLRVGNDVMERVFALLDHAEIDYVLKGRVMLTIASNPSPVTQSRALSGLGLDPDLSAAIDEVVLARV